MLKLGYKASAEQFAPSQLLDFSCLAEECGFDSIFVSDHFQYLAMLGPLALVAAGTLDAVHGGIGITPESSGIEAVVGIEGDAEAGAEVGNQRLVADPFATTASAMKFMPS